jgi:hypothetical protein
MTEDQMYDKAIAEFQKATSLSGPGPSAIARLGHAYALPGKRRLRTNDRIPFAGEPTEEDH